MTDVLVPSASISVGLAVTSALIGLMSATVPFEVNATDVAVPEMNASTVFTPVTVPKVHVASDATPEPFVVSV